MKAINEGFVFLFGIVVDDEDICTFCYYAIIDGILKENVAPFPAFEP